MSLLQNRRQFFATSLALAGAGAALSNAPRRIVLPVHSKNSIYSHTPELIPAEHLRELATSAMQAARDAGATYADIRISDSWKTRLGILMGTQPIGGTEILYSFGIRVFVNGAWIFRYGIDPTLDGVAAAARNATATATHIAPLTKGNNELPPLPRATGEWNTPYDIDPFEVGIDEQIYMLKALQDIPTRIPNGSGECDFRWTRETRVFASTEGSLTTQVLRSAIPMAYVSHQQEGDLYSRLELRLADLKPMSGGFETVLIPNLQEKMLELTERASRLSAYPIGEADVGRFEAVFDAPSIASILDKTLLPAFRIERILGRQADDAGTSFLTTNDETLGQARFSQHFTLRNDDDPSAFGARQWDDEGVETKPFTLVNQGRIVDLLRTRADLEPLQRWYTQNDMSLAPRGACIAWQPNDMPISEATAPVVEPGPTGNTFEKLIEQTTDGIVLVSQQVVNTDQQLMGALLSQCTVFQAKQGKITRRLARNAMVQLRIETLWKGLAAVGDASTVHRHLPSFWLPRPVQTPAALFAEVDLTRTPTYRPPSQ